jgi:dipeptidyl aminopeptidase/acylaminoacyl peptidase
LKSISINDLVRLERISDPQASPDGQRVAYPLRESDYAADRAH